MQADHSAQAILKSRQAQLIDTLTSGLVVVGSDWITQCVRRQESWFGFSDQ
jgi:hypothetical protein